MRDREGVDYDFLIIHSKQWDSIVCDGVYDPFWENYLIFPITF
jgi:hypothetical protein